MKKKCKEKKGLSPTNWDKLGSISYHNELNSFIESGNQSEEKMKDCKMQGISSGVSLLILRFFLAWEFLEAGLEKWNGQNWFTEIQDRFPFPFNLIPADINWHVAMGSELIFPFLLIFGVLTRFSALSLTVLISVAWYSIHADSGYNVCDNGYKLPLIYVVTLLILITQGAGKLSLDTLIKKVYPTKSWLKFL